MKLQQLHIRNIASIEEADIDFERPPLSASEVFLITGKTGAGKSTILDAICLALFANTPRLDGSRMEGVTADGEKEVKIDDPRQLMRRNTGEASAELLFTGSNGVRYRAVWAVRRAHGKPTGSLQPKEWTLANLDTGQTLVKQREVEAEMRSAVGLDFKQFCRTTMLAQGEFSRFLDSRDEEKSAILEKITGVDAYSIIGAKIYALTGDRLQQWKEAERKVEELRVLSDEELAARSEEQQRLKALVVRLNEERAAADAKRQWIADDSKLADEAARAERAWAEADQAVRREDFVRSEALVREWDETRDFRHWAADLRREEQTIGDCRRQQEALRRQYADLLGGEAAVIEGRKRLEEEQEALAGRIEAEREKAPLYGQSQRVVGLLNALADCREALRVGGEALQGLQRQVAERLAPEYQKACVQGEAAAARVAEQEAAVKAAEQQVEQMGLAGLRRQQSALADQLANLKAAADRTEAFLVEQQRHREAGQRLEEAFARLGEKRKALEALLPRRGEAEVRRDCCRLLYEKQRDTVDKFAKALRQKLQVGDVCPVCRQRVAALPAEDELSQLVQTLRTEYEAAEEALAGITAEANRLQAEAEAAAHSYVRDCKAWEADKAVAAARQKASEALRLCGVEEGPEAAAPALAARREEGLRERDRIVRLLAEGDRQEALLKQQRQQLESLRRAAEEAVKGRQKAQERLSDGTSRVKTQEALLATKRQEAAAAEAQLRDILPQAEWDGQPRAFAEALAAAADRYGKDLANLQRLCSRLEQVEAYCQSLASALLALRATLPQWEEVAASSSRKTESLVEAANALSSRSAAAAANRREAEERSVGRRRQMEDYRRQHPALTDERISLLERQTPQGVEAERSRLAAARNDLLAKATSRKEAAQHLEQHRIGKPELAEDDTPESLAKTSLSLGDQADTANQRLGALRHELAVNQESQEQLGLLLKEVQERRADYEKWSRLNELIGDSTGKKFRTIAQSYVLANLVHSANCYMKSLTDRYALRVVPGTFVLVIEDAYQGYASRAASTISGGESFLVSLSLALALSDIGERFPVDTLFIDEGFGTLSGDPLQKAVETLRSLHTKSGRRVGIISHVEELQERIPVQIRVLQEEGSSASRLETVPSAG